MIKGRRNHTQPFRCAIAGGFASPDDYNKFAGARHCQKQCPSCVIWAHPNATYDETREPKWQIETNQPPHSNQP